MALACFASKGASVEYGAVPVEWWSAIAAQASNQLIRDMKKDKLPPHVAVTLLIDAAIYCSKLDQAIIEAA